MTRRLAILIPSYLVVFAACFALAFELRYEFMLPPDVRAVLARTLPLVLGVKLAVYLVAGDWRRSFRFVTIADVASFATCAVAALLILFVVNSAFVAHPPIPRSVLVVDCMLLILALGFARGALRYYHETLRPLFGGVEGRAAVIYGTGPCSVGILRTLATSQPDLRIVGFFSNGTHSDRALVASMPVLAPQEGDWAALARRHGIEVVLVPAAVPGREVRGMIRSLAEAGVDVHVIPEVREIVDGRFTLGTREVTINDLLRREPARLDLEVIRGCTSGRRVLVTGAAGSIGSELCRQLLELQPAQLVFLDQSELGTFEIENELLGRAASRDVETTFVVADVCDRAALETVFREHRPELVFHAAAYKHVPLMERNPGEAIRNNALGTRNVVDLAGEHGVKRFVLISTDKAVRPSSVMGATKLVAEKIVQAAAGRSGTRFVTVRFGNVLNSSGSVVPIFRRQLEAGGPLTVTHPDMLRYFLTIPEAVQLVLQAAAIGESGDVLVLEMGEPVRILDLAKDMILLSGHEHHDDIGIVFTGVRPGEKLQEELFYESEASALRVHDKIFKTNVREVSPATVDAILARLEAAVRLPRERAAEILWAEVARLVDEQAAGEDGTREDDPADRGRDDATRWRSAA